MSRRTFDAHDDTWTVGYDRPLHTFYAHVEPRADLADDAAQQAAFTHRHPTPPVLDPDDLLLTVAGDSHRELTTVDQLADALAARGVTLPDTLRPLLARDQALADPRPARPALTHSDVEHGRPPARDLIHRAQPQAHPPTAGGELLAARSGQPEHDRLPTPAHRAPT
jgi:hypothetical protein